MGSGRDHHGQRDHEGQQENDDPDQDDQAGWWSRSPAMMPRHDRPSRGLLARSQPVVRLFLPLRQSLPIEQARRTDPSPIVTAPATPTVRFSRQD